MSISLFSSALPCEDSKEGRVFFTQTRLPARGKPAYFSVQYKSHLFLAKLVLEICQETAEALLDPRYKKFDALVKNFGCQITALEVMRCFQEIDFHQEAEQICHLTAQRLAYLDGLEKAPLGKCNMTFVEYCQAANLDIELSPAAAKLVRFRILNIINTNPLVNGTEKPVTDLQKLRGRMTGLETLYKNLRTEPLIYAKKHIPFEVWVHGLQAEESRFAVKYIQAASREYASESVDDRVRAEFLVKMLGDEFVRSSHSQTKSTIVSQPQLYTGEMAFRAIKGIVLLKNKTILGGEEIPGAQPIKAFVEMPGERILTSEEVSAFSARTPIIVLEGFIANDTVLEEKIAQIGVFRILNATLARLEQYASKTSQAKIEDVEAVAEIKALKKDTEAFDVMQVDHMYCASIEEER